MAITRGLADTGRAIRLPEKLLRAARQRPDIERELVDRLGRAPSSAELAESLRLTVGQATGLGGLPTVTRSLDEPLDGADEIRLGETMAADGPSVAEAVATAELPRELARLLVVLDERERVVLYLRYGLNGHEPQSLDAVARHLHVTRERVRQLQHAALDKFRHPVNRDAWERARTSL